MNLSKEFFILNMMRKVFLSDTLVYSIFQANLFIGNTIHVVLVPRFHQYYISSKTVIFTEPLFQSLILQIYPWIFIIAHLRMIFMITIKMFTSLFILSALHHTRTAPPLYLIISLLYKTFLKLFPQRGRHTRAGCKPMTCVSKQISTNLVDPLEL